MREKTWLTPVFISSIVLLLLIQVIHLVVFYNYVQDQNSQLQKLNQADVALENNLEQLSSTVSDADESLRTDIANARTDLGESILHLQNQLEISEASFNAQLQTLEASQEATASQLSASIKNIQLNNQDFSSTIQDVLPAVVSVLTDDGVGSGVIVTSDGYVMTNYHVIEDANVIRVLTYDGSVHPVRVLGAAQSRDLAVLDILTDEEFERLRFEEDTFVGQNVVAIGNPGGLGFSVTEGIVSNTNRLINGQTFIQISAPINSGNSGGPLINIDGDIVGINTLKLSGFEGVGFAIPAQDAKDILDQAIALSTP